MAAKQNKICIILPCNTVWAPYYFKYEKMLTDNGSGFDVILWNRSGEQEKLKGRLIEYRMPDKTNNGKWTKFWKFFSFAAFVQREIRHRIYEKLIFLGTYGGNALLINRFLKKNYAGRCWLDIRDYTYEWMGIFRKLEKETIDNAFCTVISSGGFRKILPENRQYLLFHNIDEESIRLASAAETVREDGVIRISFIGNMGKQYVAENKKLLDLFANDERFLMQYFGTGNDVLKQYCKDRGIQNTLFEGRFERKDIGKFYARTDVINNLYGNHEKNLQLALSNKLYFSLALGKPILVCKNTYMQKAAVKAGNGFVIDDTDGIREQFLGWYNSFDAEKCKKAYTHCLKQNEKVREVFLYFIREKL